MAPTFSAGATGTVELRDTDDLDLWFVLKPCCPERLWLPGLGAVQCIRPPAHAPGHRGYLVDADNVIMDLDTVWEWG
jgi:hypothetical protein